METVRLSMAQALIRFLDQQYFCVDGVEQKFVEGIFAIFGHGNVTGLGEALEFSEHKLKFIRGNNEQGMAHAATAFAKQHNRGKIYAVTSSIGPGATNLVTAAALATINRLPLLLLPGDIFASRAPDPVLQQLENFSSHDISVNECFRPVSRYFDRINRPEQLMTALLKAFKVLTDPYLTGAVTICLPQDVQCESFDYPTAFFKKRVHHLERRAPQLEFVQEAAAVIARSERPLIIAGGGVHYSFAPQSLQKFAHEFSLPVCETQAGKSALVDDCPENMGGIGVIGTHAANRLAQKADCIIAIGTRLSDFITSSKSGFPQTCRIISINVDPLDGIKLEPTVTITADAHLTLQALSLELNRIGYLASRATKKRYTDEKLAWQTTRNRLLEENHGDGALNQVHVLATLNHHCDDNAVIVAAAGSLPGDLQRMWQAKSVKGYHLEYGYSCMGYEVAGALGVKMAEPNREVWAAVGDGSFLMMHSELVTAIQEGLKINILLFDSGGFNCIKGLQCAMGSNGYGTDLRFKNQFTSRYDGDIIPINFAQYAEALGVKSFTAHSIDELVRHITSARQEARSTLVEVKVRPGTQSQGYDTWWHVPVSDVSSNAQVMSAHKNMAKGISAACRY